jgi:hypothetical protein
MITRLEAKSNVEAHIDPYEYFETYSRFHIPIITNKNVVFNGDTDTPNEHMPVQTLCRLNNRKLHGVSNNGDDFRVHIVIDIEIEGQNNIF